MVRTVMLREVDKHSFRDLLIMIKSSWQCHAEDVYTLSPAWQQIRCTPSHWLRHWLYHMLNNRSLEPRI